MGYHSFPIFSKVSKVRPPQTHTCTKRIGEIIDTCSTTPASKKEVTYENIFPFLGRHQNNNTHARPPPQKSVYLTRNGPAPFLEEGGAEPKEGTPESESCYGNPWVTRRPQLGAGDLALPEIWHPGGVVRCLRVGRTHLPAF